MSGRRWMHAAMVALATAISTAGAGAGDEPFVGGDLDPAAGCVPGAGSCFVARPEAGCEQPECCALVCDLLPECCDEGWDELCVDVALGLCEPAAACTTATGDCFAVHKDGGCADGRCCEVVCAIDGFCCGSYWDEACVVLAREACGGEACRIPLVLGALEDEGCFEAVNDGCDQPGGFAAQDLALGTVLGGTIRASVVRDVDWYRLPAAPGPISIRVAAEFPAEVSVMVGDCDVTGITPIRGVRLEPCAPQVITLAEVPADAWVVVSTATTDRPIFFGVGCNAARAMDPPRYGAWYSILVEPDSTFVGR